MSQSKEIFAAFSLRLGARLDFDVDCRPWLTGTAVLTGFVPDPADAGPVTYEAASIVEAGKGAKFFASVPNNTAHLGTYRVGVELTDNQGRTDRQWFQMKVE
jgi:hypothetical protein